MNKTASTDTSNECKEENTDWKSDFSHDLDPTTVPKGKMSNAWLQRRGANPLKLRRRKYH